MSWLVELKKSYRKGLVGEPDTVLAWWNLSLTFLIMVVAAGHLISLGSFFVALHDTYEITREEAARILNFIHISNFFTGIAAGPISLKIGPKLTIIMGLLISSTSLLASFFQSTANGTFWKIKTCFSFHGGGIGLVAPILVQIISYNFIRHRGKAMTVFLLSMSFNGFIFPWIINYFIETYGLKGSFLLLGGFSLQAIILVVALRVKSSSTRTSSKKERKTLTNDKATNDLENNISKATAAPNEATFSSKVYKVLTNLKFYNLLYSQSLGVATYYTMVTTIVDLGLDSNLDLASASALLVLHSAGDLVARVFTGWLCDRRLLSNQFITAVGLVFKSATITLIVTVNGGLFLKIMVAVSGFAFGVCSTSRMVLLPQLGVDVTALVFGMNTFVSGCFFAVMPTLIGVFRDHLGSYMYLYVLLSCLNFVSGLLYFIEDFFVRRNFAKLEVVDQIEMNRPISQTKT